MRAVVLPLATSLLGVASPAGGAQRPDLATTSLEDLMNIEITTVSRREEPLSEAAAAVYVITADDIQRSGVATIPEVLRLAPGVDVAQINANKWAVSIRGFNGLYADKLLVMVDGRTVYNRLFSGVLWDTPDVRLDDVERIEVIRGPGGATWGTNAVNGVINIITKPSAATAGAQVHLAAGTFDRANVSASYSGAGTSWDYRAYSQWLTTGDSVRPATITAGDGANQLLAGVRADWTHGHDTIFVDGHASAERDQALWLAPTQSPNPSPSLLLGGESRMSGGAATLRWTRHDDDRGDWQLQTAFDLARRDEAVGQYARNGTDLDMQYRAPKLGVHDLVVGGSYHFSNETFEGRNGYLFAPPTSDVAVTSAFAQDQLSLAGGRLKVSLGAKTEHTSDIGWNFQPTARVLWRVGPSDGHVWGAVSHAVRTPSLQDRFVQVDFHDTLPSGLPTLVTFNGNATLQSETVRTAEVGYRIETSHVTVDVAAFDAVYDKLRSTEFQPPSLQFTAAGPLVVTQAQFGNLFAADTHGVEVDARWQPIARWRLDGTYATFALEGHALPGSVDPTAATFDGSAPTRSWRARSALNLWRRADLTVSLFHTGDLPSLAVPAYTRLDARLAWRLAPNLTIAAIGQNLLDPAHPEFAVNGIETWATEIPRSASIELTWTKGAR